MVPATHPLDSLNYALNSILPAPGVKPDADPGPLIDANSGNRTPPTAGAVVTPPTMTCAPTGQCAMMPGTATPGTPGYVPYTATVSSGSHDGQPASSGTGGAATNSSNTGNGGAAANAVGAAREQAVADLVQGTRSGEIIRTPAGSTDVDVTDAAGNLYAVGGPAKARNLGSFVQSLTIYSQTAATRGVDAYFYYAEGTPQSVINAAAKVLGTNFVKPIP